MRIKSRLQRPTLANISKNAGPQTWKNCKENESTTAEKAFDGSQATEKPIRVKDTILVKVGMHILPIGEAWIVPNFRRQFVACKLPAGEWIVVHSTTDYCVVFGASSKEFCFRVMELVRPYINAAKAIRGFWDDQKEAVGETVHDYLQHVWRADYQTHELPTVKQWLKSGLKNSHKKWYPSIGKIAVRKRKP